MPPQRRFVATGRIYALICPPGKRYGMGEEAPAPPEWRQDMNKFVATLCVISWAGFWVFGYIALTTGVQNSGQLTVAVVLAAAGLFTGVFTYLRIARATDPARWNHVPQV
jgi:hypothetical protein